MLRKSPTFGSLQKAATTIVMIITVLRTARSSLHRSLSLPSHLAPATVAAFVSNDAWTFHTTGIGIVRHRHYAPPSSSSSSSSSKLRTERPSKVQRWKAPMLSPSVSAGTAGRSSRASPSLSRGGNPGATTASESSLRQQRPPRLYKRTVLFGAKSDVNANDSRLYRADRVLANRTGKSRKECFQLLQEGRVFEVVEAEIMTMTNDDTVMDASSSAKSDGTGENSSTTTITVATKDDRNTNMRNLVPIRGPSAKVAMNANLRIDKHQMVPLPPPLLAVYYKPKWVLSVRNDPLGRPCLDDVFDHGHNGPLHPVGRLDYDTTGLLLFSSSGPLTQALLHPKHAIEKEYVATVTGRVDEAALATTLANGVTTGEGVHTATVLSVSHMADDAVRAYLQSIQSELPSVYNTTDLKLRGYLDIFDATALSIVTLTVSEGKHRMVRRMLANTGHPVVSLHRARIGAIRLETDDSDRDSSSGATGTPPTQQLRPGQSRSLTPLELRWAQQQLKQGRSSMPVPPDTMVLSEEEDTEDVG